MRMVAQAEPSGDGAKPSAAAPKCPVAIICGGGGLPLRVAEAAARRGRKVVLIGIRGAADPAIARFPHVWIKIGQGGGVRRAVVEHGCGELCMIGNLTRPNLASLGLDWESLRMGARIARLFVGGDDRLLSGVARIFEETCGVKVVGAHEIAPEILAPEGAMGRHTARSRDLADIRTGLAVLRALGPYDVGQAAVVGEQRVWGIEAAEGTDGLLERIADLRRTGRIRVPEGVGVLVKAPKPNQDLRVDLPAIGPRTVEVAARAGLAGLAVQADATLVAEPENLVAAADRAKLFVFGIGKDEPADAPA